MKLRSILASLLLAAAPFAGAQSVDYVIVRAAANDGTQAAQPQAAATATSEQVSAAGKDNTAAVAKDLDTVLEQRFSIDDESQASERLLVSAN